MEKIDKERDILSLAETLLSELYGEFCIVTEQTDRPDAAINIKKCGRRIGIEITSVDKEKDQEYLNNEKITSKVSSQQINSLLVDGICSSRPTKRLSISFPKDYIFESVIKKAEKYQSYAESRKYGEILILAFSSYLNAGDSAFNEYHKPWTNFLLSEKYFPFDKVIFVSEHTRKVAVVYNKESPLRDSPLVDCEKETGITVVKGPIYPIGQTVDIDRLFSEAPHVPFGKKSKQQKKSAK